MAKKIGRLHAFKTLPQNRMVAASPSLDLASGIPISAPKAALFYKVSFHPLHQTESRQGYFSG